MQIAGTAVVPHPLALIDVRRIRVARFVGVMAVPERMRGSVKGTWASRRRTLGGRRVAATVFLGYGGD
jgi:hypothetical protein